MSNFMSKKWWMTPKFWLILIVIVGSVVRLAALGRLPMGLHQDEAYSAYNALSVMRYGIDSYGYAHPVYYTVWGSGMSVLYSYLTMPFLAIMGVNTWAIRLPQAILGCISILAAYGLGKELFHEKYGVIFAGILSINPWHIQQSRFGLDANLAVPMFLFAILFLCRYLNGKRKSLLPATIFFGLTLYCYAITWMLVPAILVLCLLFYPKRIQFDKNLLGCILLLAFMALPLLLFLAVNFDLVPEFKSAFISIPKLPQIRAGEISFGQIKTRFLWLVSMLLAGHDDNWWITNTEVGAYYYISLPFILTGLLCHAKTLWDSIKNKKPLPLHFIMALWFGVMFIIGCGIESAKFYKVNCIHIPIIFYTFYGLINICAWLKKVKWLPCLAAGVYAVSFLYFIFTQVTYEVNYNNYGNNLLSRMNWYKYELAIDYAESITDGDISILQLNYANVMLYKQISPYEFMDDAVYTDENLAFRQLSSIGRYHFGLMPGEDTKDMVFIFPYGIREIFEESNYTIVEADECYGVAYLEN